MVSVQTNINEVLRLRENNEKLQNQNKLMREALEWALPMIEIQHLENENVMKILKAYYEDVLGHDPRIKLPVTAYKK